MSSMVVLLIGLAAAQSAAGAVTAEDLRVIDAALSHTARSAQRSRFLLLSDRTLPVCEESDRSAFSCIPTGPTYHSSVQRKISELTPEAFEALASRNAVPQLLAAAPARDVILTPRDNVAEAMKQHGANVSASTSLPAYLDADTAVIYVGYGCGRGCGRGSFLLLRRSGERWKVRKSAMTWIA